MQGCAAHLYEWSVAIGSTGTSTTLAMCPVEARKQASTTVAHIDFRVKDSRAPLSASGFSVQNLSREVVRVVSDNIKSRGENLQVLPYPPTSPGS